MAAKPMTVHEIISEKEKVFRYGYLSSREVLWTEQFARIPTKDMINASVATIRIELLENQIRILTERLEKLSQKYAELRKIQEKTIIIREIPRKEAEREIRKLFESGEILDYGIIAERLQLSLPFVVDICNELEEKGEIGESG